MWLLSSTFTKVLTLQHTHKAVLVLPSRAVWPAPAAVAAVASPASQHAPIAPWGAAQAFWSRGKDAMTAVLHMAAG
jgi:hypothetical protein